MANKGGVYFQLKINNERFGFINCHLCSGTSKQNFERRRVSLLQFEKFLKEKKLDGFFIFGDMNFRNKCKIEQA